MRDLVTSFLIIPFELFALLYNPAIYTVLFMFKEGDLSIFNLFLMTIKYIYFFLFLN